MEVVGLIPACGSAERLSPLPCSKEIMPVGLQRSEFYGKTIPQAVCDHLLSYYRNAGVGKAIWVIRSDKQDIPKYLEKRKDLDFEWTFIEKDASPGAPFTVDYAFPYTKDKIVALGFPDILIRPGDAYATVLKKLANESSLDMVLGLFPIKRKYSWDMVAFDGRRVNQIVIKSPDTQLTYGWTIAIWRPSFTAFLHQYLKHSPPPGATGLKELHVGHTIQAAIDSGMNVGHMLFEDGGCIDVGKPEDLAVAYQKPKF